MSTFNNAYEVNGLIDTTNDVMRNMEQLADSVGAWVTFDIHRGKWSFVLNQTDDPVHAFDESNIIGEVIVSGTGLNELYNSCEVRFPHKDLADQTDFRRLTINPNDRYPNENDNRLTINMTTVNDPVVAEKIAYRELRQSRQDTVVQFRTDFSGMGLNAGDVITLTLEPHGFNLKEFRIQQITEEDDDDGNITLGITALEYSASIYDYSQVQRYTRERNKQVQIKEANAAIQGSELASLRANDFTQMFPATFGASVSTVQSNIASWGSVITFGGGGLQSGAATTIAFTTQEDYTQMIITANSASGLFDYEYYDNATGSVGTRTSVYAFIPMQVTLSSDSGLIATYSVDWQTSASTFTVNDVHAGNYYIDYTYLPTYDLNQSNSNRIFHYNQQLVADANGNGVTVNVLGFKVGT